MGDESVLVIGAGAAGLMAARELARAGAEVEVLEARERLGGRIHTLPKTPGSSAIELGAEFIHGSENEVWQIVEGGKLDTHKVPDRHWRPGAEGLIKQKKFWNELEQVFSRLNPAAPDQDFRSFIDQAWSINDAAKKLALDYVEGFHAAPADRISVHALAKAEAAAEREHATRAFRLTDGYGAMISLLSRELERLGVRVSTDTTVRRLNWEPGHVEAVAQTASGERSLRAGCAVVTLPLGVLQGGDPRRWSLNPDCLANKEPYKVSRWERPSKSVCSFVRDFGLIITSDLSIRTIDGSAHGGRMSAGRF